MATSSDPAAVPTVTPTHYGSLVAALDLPTKVRLLTGATTFTCRPSRPSDSVSCACPTVPPGCAG